MPTRKDKQREKQKRLRQAKRKQRRLGVGGPGGPMIVHTPPGHARMSEVLVDFLDPYMDDCQDEKDLRNFLLMGMTAWNIALESGTQRQQMLEDSLAKMPRAYRDDARSVLEELIQRKDAHFAGIKRVMLDYELTMTPDGPHVQVLSSFEDV